MTQDHPLIGKQRMFWTLSGGSVVGCADVTATSMNTQGPPTLEGSELPHSWAACWGASESRVATLMLSRYSSTLTCEHV